MNVRQSERIKVAHEERETKANDEELLEIKCTNAVVPFKINLNTHAVKTGRPRMDRAEAESKERQSRREFNDTATRRRSAGEVTLDQLADSLSEDQPGLEELERQLSPISVRHQNFCAPKLKLCRSRGSDGERCVLCTAEVSI